MKRLALNGLQPGRNYSVQVRSKANAGTSEWSQALDFTAIVDTAPPSVVTGLSWTSVGTSWLATWNAIDIAAANNYDFAYYEVKVTYSSSSVVYKTSTTRFEFTLEQNIAAFGQPRSPLSVSVRTLDTTGNASAWVDSPSVANPAPAAPTGLTVTSGLETLGLKWTPPADTDIAYYRVYTSSSAGGTYSLVGSPRTNAYDHTSLVSSTVYFRVFSVDVFGTESSTYASGSGSARVAMVVDTEAPNAPTGVGVTTGFDQSAERSWLQVSWTASTSTDLGSHEIRYSVDGGTTFSYLPVQKGTNTARIFVDPGKTYTVDVRAVDWTGNSSAFVTATESPITSAADTSAPSTPAAPNAVGNAQQIQVSHSRKKADGTTDMEPDVARYDVYASKVDGFTTYDATTLLGSISGNVVTSGVFKIPNVASSGNGAVSESWYVKVRAVDRAGNVSPASAQYTVVPGLINGINIAEATITSAHITELRAEKLTAGSGIVTDLTIGNASQSGRIRSYGYVAGSTGWSLEKTTLEINDGLIKAKTLELQQGQNIINPLYADFELRPAEYVGKLLILQGGMIFAVANGGREGFQSLGTVWGTNTVNPQLALGSSATDYNIKVEGGKRYIFSLYGWCAGAVATNLQLRVKWSNGSISTLDSKTLAAGTAPATAQRLFGSIQAPAGVTGALIILESSTRTANAGYGVDAVQVEEQWGAQTSPSPWTPPSSTTINGGQITTGTMASNNYVSSGGTDGWAIGMNGDVFFSNGTFRGTIKATGGEIEQAIKIASAGSFYIGASPTNYSLLINSTEISTFSSQPTPVEWFPTTSYRSNAKKVTNTAATQELISVVGETTAYVRFKLPATNISTDTAFVAWNNNNYDYIVNITAIGAWFDGGTPRFFIGRPDGKITTNQVSNGLQYSSNGTDDQIIFPQPSGWGTPDWLHVLPGVNTNTLLMGYVDLSDNLRFSRRYGASFGTLTGLLSTATYRVGQGTFRKGFIDYDPVTNNIFAVAVRNSDSVPGILQVNASSGATTFHTNTGVSEFSGLSCSQGYIFYSTNDVSLKKATTAAPATAVGSFINVPSGINIGSIFTHAASAADALANKVQLFAYSSTSASIARVELGGTKAFSVDYSAGITKTNYLEVPGKANVGVLQAETIVPRPGQGLYINTRVALDYGEESQGSFDVKAGSMSVDIDEGEFSVFGVSSVEGPYDPFIRINSSGLWLQSAGGISIGANASIGITGNGPNTQFVNNTSHSGAGSRVTNSASSGFMYLKTDGTVLFRVTENGVYAQTGVTARSVMVNSNGVLGYNSSTLKVKDMIMPADFKIALASLELDLWSYKYRDGNPANDGKRHWGVIAEQAHEAGLYDLVYYENPKVPDYDTIDGFAYEKLAAYHGPVIKWTYEEVLAINERNEVLEAKVAEQDEQIADLAEKVRQIMEGMVN